MFKLLPACMAFLLVLTACQTRNNTEAIKALDKSLTKANEVITANNEMVYQALKEKLKDPHTEAKAAIWTPRALAVRSLSKEIYKYIGNLKLQLGAMKDDDKAGVRELFQKEGESLYNKLIRYNKEVVLALNPEAFRDYPSFEAQLKQEMESFKKDIAVRSGIPGDSVPGQSLHNQNWQKTYLHPSSLWLGMALLNKMQSDVLVTENYIIDYINNQTRFLINHYEEFHAVTALSSSYVKAGQAIEVTVGVGAFSAASKPTITINGSVMNASEDGVAINNLKTNQKPGKYTVPVSIQYTRPDGSPSKVIKNLEYIIAQ